MQDKKAILVLEDGTIFRGNYFGASKEIFGEVVFSTGMTGYQEALTDPSYRGQILTLTYPLVGNYGINSEDFESDKIQVRGLIVSEHCLEPSNYRSEKTLDKFLKEHKIPGVYGIDTRALTRVIRQHGTMRGKICKDGINVKQVVKELKETPYPDSKDLIPEVTRKKIETHGTGETIVLLDIGAKQNIINCLTERGLQVKVVPGNTSFKEILKFKPDGILISNGPGDPTKPAYAIETIRQLIDTDIPIMGICLGHQVLALAAGAKTYKLKFGHRGLNHPVQDSLGKVNITTQNHGYAVDVESLKNTDFEVTHLSLNDNSVEGMKHKNKKIFSVQYHPEGSPGPKDNEYLFDEFARMVRND